MKLIKFDDASEYYRQVEKHLLEYEAVNCLPLASSLSLCSADRHQAYLALVKDNRDILATAIHIGDRKLLLSKSMNLSAVKLIAEDLVVDSRSIPGVTAPQLEAETFVADWQNRTEQSIELEMVMSIQQLEKINDIDSAVGKLRLAVLEETELLTDWIQAFVKEALGINESKAAMRKWVIRYIEQDSLYVWENKKQSVSMAACGGKTNQGIRVQSVYTPPEYRGNGYATSCVAAMSKIILEQRKYCFLFTNLTNSASNKIYCKLGYIQMGDIKDYKFH